VAAKNLAIVRNPQMISGAEYIGDPQDILAILFGIQQARPKWPMRM
jgi:hypothetical protein